MSVFDFGKNCKTYFSNGDFKIEPWQVERDDTYQGLDFGENSSSANIVLTSDGTGSSAGEITLDSDYGRKDFTINVGVGPLKTPIEQLQERLLLVVAGYDAEQIAEALVALFPDEFGADFIRLLQRALAAREAKEASVSVAEEEAALRKRIQDKLRASGE